jgi:hypothetical protein
LKRAVSLAVVFLKGGIGLFVLQSSVSLQDGKAQILAKSMQQREVEGFCSRPVDQTSSNTQILMPVKPASQLFSSPDLSALKHATPHIAQAIALKVSPPRIRMHFRTATLRAMKVAMPAR